MKQYVPLYLRYRPQSLSELVGQEVVAKTLSNAIKYEKIVHAYLFCGPRGTGKTSTARILAKSLNCESGSTIEPCGKCNSCKSITDGNSLDVVEIDAASHRKVEDAEDLINRVNLSTYGSRYKIYIIDEVHMLTDHAFNALLKTLEEPPKNVIFILATTEDHKVIQTIVSRCQKLDFKPIGQNELKKRIEQIAKKEKINIDDSILSFISKRSAGCLRDAVSLLDQLSVLQEGDSQINANEVYDLFGTVDRQELFKLMSYLFIFDKKNAITAAENLVKSGKDLSELFKSLVELSIDLAKAKIDSKYKVELSKELDNDLSEIEKVTYNHILKIIDSLHQGQGKLRFALSQELQFMTQIMIFLDEDFLVSLTELKSKVDALSSGDQKLERRNKKSEVGNQKSEIEFASGITPLAARTNNMSPSAAPVKGISPSAEQSGVSRDKEIDEQIQEDTVVQVPSNEAVTENKVSDLGNTWKKVVDSLLSIPTKTLLIQAESYLLKINDDFAEVGIGKDMFLPRLKSDDKKKTMLLNALKQITGVDAKDIRYIVKKGDSPLNADSRSATYEKTMEEKSVQSEALKSKVDNCMSETDEFSQAMKDLLGAKQID